MLKRLVGVITVKDGWAVQSMGYQRYLPLGRPEILAENYDRWFLDEILIVSIDRTRKGLGPDLELVERVAARNLMTPLTYAGGIRSGQDARDLVRAGADRLCLEYLFDTDPDACRDVRDAVGVQAVIRALPLQRDGNKVSRFDYMNKTERAFNVESLTDADDLLFSELLIIDRKGEGGKASYDPALLSQFEGSGLQIIAFGGITEKHQVQDLLGRDNISAVAVGNSLAYREIANRDLIDPAAMHDTRTTSHGEKTRGVRQW